MKPHTKADRPQDDAEFLATLGYKQELDRRMGGFSNFAISFSIICILAGGITSFHLGFNALGGGAIGIGWPLACLFSLIVAATMGQLASAYPTAGGLYHWASILGGRGWGWVTAWLNLAGLITVLAAINVGTFLFIMGALGPKLGISWEALTPQEQFGYQAVAVIVMSASQGYFNHRGIRLTTRLTDFSGYLILVVALALTISLLVFTRVFDFSRLYTFVNYSGEAGGDVWPASGNFLYLFALGLLLPAYTITGFDASAHTSEETISARINVPKGILRSVLVSGFAGWIMLAAVVLAMPNPDLAARQGAGVFFSVMDGVLPGWLSLTLFIGIALAQYLCGLATVTSASRMLYAFARDGGVPFSTQLRKVSPRYLTPAHSVWVCVALSALFTLYTPVYSTITVVCVIFLYLSYVLPTALGLWYHGRTWSDFGPWDLGRWYKPLAFISVLGSLILIWIGVQPPNYKAVSILLSVAAIMTLYWMAIEHRRFQGPRLLTKAAFSEGLEKPVVRGVT
ncbi:MAG TPA: amino acid permease [Oligoflexus sp.]|uniref:amino acid permease n=1 Tax=Oligoflexus sp. TaxID=1971216 RepID=UPI002D703039|nr:amino acid permease [Oligoflexus sp.]HYX38807.1 amino acid permease [Oligoflexus sp.]